MSVVGVGSTNTCSGGMGFERAAFDRGRAPVRDAGGAARMRGSRRTSPSCTARSSSSRSNGCVGWPRSSAEVCTSATGSSRRRRGSSAGSRSRGASRASTFGSPARWTTCPRRDARSRRARSRCRRSGCWSRFGMPRPMPSNGEPQLVEAARIHSVSDVHRVAAFWREAVEREQALDGENRLRARRRLHASVSLLGMVRGGRRSRSRDG